MYICIFSNKFDLNQAACVSHIIKVCNLFDTGILIKQLVKRKHFFHLVLTKNCN